MCFCSPSRAFVGIIYMHMLLALLNPLFLLQITQEHPGAPLHGIPYSMTQSFLDDPVWQPEPRTARENEGHAHPGAAARARIAPPLAICPQRRHTLSGAADKLWVNGRPPTPLSNVPTQPMGFCCVLYNTLLCRTICFESHQSVNLRSEHYV